MGAYRAAKLRLFDTLLMRGGAAVLNADSDAFSAFAGAAMLGGHTIMSVGAMGEGLTLTGRTAAPGGQTLKVSAWGVEHSLFLPLAGAFQASNALIAAGLAIAAGVRVEVALGALEHLEAPQDVCSTSAGGRAAAKPMSTTPIRRTDFPPCWRRCVRTPKAA